MSRIITPWNNAPEPKGPSIEMLAEDIGRCVCKFIDDLVRQSLKELNGELMPNDKMRRKHLRVIIHPNGRMFLWKNQPMLWVAHYKMEPGLDGKLQLQIPWKQMYKEPPKVLAEVNPQSN